MNWLKGRLNVCKNSDLPVLSSKTFMCISFWPARFFAFLKAARFSKAFPVAKPPKPLPFPVTTNTDNRLFLPKLPFMLNTVFNSSTLVSKPSNLSKTHECIRFYMKKNLMVTSANWIRGSNTPAGHFRAGPTTFARAQFLEFKRTHRVT